MKHASWLVVTICAIGAWWVFDACSHPLVGQPVSLEEATQIRGGCDKLVTATCDPGNNAPADCLSGTKVTSGGDDANGKGKSNMPCSSSCGSFFREIEKCAE
jgi:hypothetical protein